MRILNLYFICFFLSVSILSSQDAPDESQLAIRPAVFADSLYPSDKEELINLMTEMMFLSKEDNTTDLKVIVVPHSSYFEASKVYTTVYDHLTGLNYDAVYIIAAAQKEKFKGISVFSGSGYYTPLGTVFNDTILAKNLANQHPEILYTMAGHYNSNGENESVLELQMPYIKHTMPEAKVVPILIGEQNDIIIDILTTALLSVIDTNKKNLIIIVSELSNNQTPEDTKAYDLNALRDIEKLDYVKLQNTVFDTWYSDSYAPLITGMIIADKIDAHMSKRGLYLIPEINDPAFIPDEESKVHGIFSIAYFRDIVPYELRLVNFDDSEQEILLSKTRERMMRHFLNDSTPMTPLLPKKFGVEIPVNLKIYINNELVSEKFSPFSYRPLLHEVQLTALDAIEKADEKSRELMNKKIDKIKLELTIFSKMELVTKPDDFDFTKDAVIVKNNKTKEFSFLLPDDLNIRTPEELINNLNKNYINNIFSSDVYSIYRAHYSILGDYKK